MQEILEVKNLNYQAFQNIDLTFQKGKIYSVIGSNKSGKTTLFRILSGLELTNNVISCNNICLNNNTRKNYMKEIGVVKSIIDQKFKFQNVFQEAESKRAPFQSRTHRNYGFSRTSIFRRNPNKQSS